MELGAATVWLFSISALGDGSWGGVSYVIHHGNSYFYHETLQFEIWLGMNIFVSLIYTK